MSRAARRGPWLPEEDRALSHLVQAQGANNWVRISQQLQHRSPKQCRERYHQNLKPSLKHEPISAQEGEIIEQMVGEMGKRWAEIARHLGNRSDNAVKNWWNGSMNRRRRNPTHTGAGFKQMGPRLQPIPFTNVENLTENHHRQHHHHPHHFSRPLPVEHSSALQDVPHPSTRPLPPPPLPPPPPPPAPPSFPVASNSTSTSAYYQNRWYHEQPPHSLNAPEIRQRHHPSSPLYPAFPKPVFSRSTVPEDRQELPPLRRTSYSEGRSLLPMISPAVSEVRQAPSLISDHLSTCSVSPKTVTSPQPAASSQWGVLPVLQDSSYQPLDHPRQTSALAMAPANKVRDTRMHVSNLLD